MKVTLYALRFSIARSLKIAVLRECLAEFHQKLKQWSPGSFDKEPGYEARIPFVHSFSHLGWLLHLHGLMRVHVVKQL